MFKVESINQMFKSPPAQRGALSWWRLLIKYYSDPESMRSNPLLAQPLRNFTRTPRFRPEIRWLWVFPFLAVAGIVAASQSMGESGALSAAVGVTSAALICTYPPYWAGGMLSFLVPARVAASISREVEARTFDILRLTGLTPAEIVVGKMMAPLLRFSGLINYMGTFFTLIFILGVLGSGAVPVSMGLAPEDALVGMIVVEFPLIFGPLVTLAFVNALSMAISAHTSQPQTSIVVTYTVLAGFWATTGIAFVAILVVLRATALPDSQLLEIYATNPFALMFPNTLRIGLGLILTPVLMHLSVRRIENAGEN